MSDIKQQLSHKDAMRTNDSINLEISSAIMHQKKSQYDMKRKLSKPVRHREHLMTIYQQKSKNKQSYLPYLQKLPTPRLAKKGGKSLNTQSKKSAVKEIVNSIVFKFQH